MLTARKGLNLEQKQQIPLRVALDFVSKGSSSSSWGSQAVNVPQNAHLLLWGKPLKHIPGRMSSTEVLPGYEVLYGDALGSAAITAALDKLGKASGSSSSRPKRGRAAAPAGETEEAGGGISVDLAEAAVAEAGSSSAVDLAAALAAVNTLALSLTAEEADAANEAACRAVLPLLRAASDSTRVQVVREGLQRLHAAAVTGELVEAGLQQRVQEALRCLAAAAGGGQQQHEVAAAVAEAPIGSSGRSSKRRRVDLKPLNAGEPMTIDDLPCLVCGISEGSHVLVCDWCCRGAGHLGCLGLAEVPEAVWCCSSKCEQHREEAQAAADLHGRWVVGEFQGVEGAFWGQLSYVSFGVLKLQYSDGELYEGVRVGHERLLNHRALVLMPKGCTVPPKVLKVFRGKGWLV